MTNKLVDLMASRSRPLSEIARLERTILMPMRDGTLLSTDFYFPKHLARTARLPVILLRTPYNKNKYRAGEVVPANFEKYHELILRFVEAGFVFAIQDKRGKYESTGTYRIYTGDADDGEDTVAWIADQSWSNGRIGTYGCSYSGDVQIIMAQRRSPFHRAMVAQGASGGGRFPYIAVRLGGAFELAMYMGWLRQYGTHVKYSPPADASREDIIAWGRHFKTDPSPPPLSHADLKRLWAHLPVADIMDEADSPPTLWRELLQRELDDPWWKTQFDFVDEQHSIDVPGIFENSWYDFGVVETLNEFNKFQRIGVTESARRNQFAIISPTCHCESSWAQEHTVVGQRDLGDARWDYFDLYVRWFRHWLLDDVPGDFEASRVTYYLMGANTWRAADAWPVPGTQFQPMYLRSGGRANSRFGDGVLSFTPPGNEPADSFTYDPATPVPSLGGPLCCTGTPDQLEGALDQREIETRHDVLVYTSEPLRDALTVVGPLELVLYVSSDARDTDFTAKLVDVLPDGTAFNLQEGILRARYREGFDKKVWLSPGEVVQLSVDLQATANRFLPGHRVRIEVSSSNFPRFDRNMNTGGANYDETTWKAAHNSVHHDSGHASHIRLPVLPD